MSGGKSNVDPYYQKDPPKRSKSKKGPPVPKSYRNAVKPKKIEVIPPCPEHPRGKTLYYYDCNHCGKETKGARKTAKHAFCDRSCHHEWQKYTKSTFSDEARRKISEAGKRSWGNQERRAKRIESMRKAVQSPEYREKRSEIAKEVSSRPEWKEKQSKAHKGKKRPPEVGRKVSEAKMGHEVSEETRRKLSEANKGEKSSFYIDGRSSERQKFYRGWIWRKQRGRVLYRDNRTCQGCGWTEDEAGPLEGHHIDPLRETEYDWNRYPDDLVASLCDVCHPKSDKQEGRMRWPINGRGDEARLERLRDPKSWQTCLDEFSEPDDR